MVIVGTPRKLTAIITMVLLLRSRSGFYMETNSVPESCANRTVVGLNV